MGRKAILHLKCVSELKGNSGAVFLDGFSIIKFQFGCLPNRQR